MEKNKARLLFEAGKCLLEIKTYLTFKGSSQQLVRYLKERPHKLEITLKTYPKEKILEYERTLKRYNLKSDADTLAEDYTKLEKLVENYAEYKLLPSEITGILKDKS